MYFVRVLTVSKLTIFLNEKKNKIKVHFFGLLYFNKLKSNFWDCTISKITLGNIQKFIAKIELKSNVKK